MDATRSLTGPATAPLDPTALTAPDGQRANSAETAKKFEELIATLLVKEMRKGLPEGFFGKGVGSDTFDGWLDTTLGSNLASSWDLDLAGMVKTDLDRKQAQLDGALGAQELAE
ncbi:MAG: hypothetical protein H6828_14150 [Planctomycetes bacterium]|nr:hypothetical protein [Planctomycetota bacterium]